MFEQTIEEYKFDENVTRIPDKNAYHPAMPSIEGAQHKYDMVTSDHVPLLTEVPSPKNSAGLDKIVFVTWNVLESDGGNGFSLPKANGMRYGENLTQTRQRHYRIAKALAKFVKDYNPQFITLQEILANESDPNGLFNIIKKVLGDQYDGVTLTRKMIEEKKNEQGEFIPHEVPYQETVDTRGCITLFNKKLFKPVIPEALKKKDLLHAEMGGNITKFVSLDDPNFEVRISNVHHKFNDNITIHEKDIEKFLINQDTNKLPVDKNKNTLSIAIGDFNGSISSLNSAQQNTTTSVAPPGFREDGLQGAWAIDGAFYTVDNATCHQAETRQLNPLTGKIYDPKDLDISMFDNLDAAQRAEVNRLRPIICVDEAYKTKKIFNEYTIATYEQKLRTTFSDNNIWVRVARNLKNEEGITIMADLELCYYLGMLKNPAFQLNFIDNEVNGIPYYFISTDAAHVKQLDEALNFIAKNKHLYQLSKNIRSISKKTTPEVHDHFRELFRLFHDQKVDVKNPTYSAIINYVNRETEAIKLNPKRTIKQIEQSAEALDKELHGKPPMDPKIKMILWGLVGALVGAVIGFIGGALVTAHVGGLGGIPAALVGAFKGFSLGTAIATGAFTLGGIISGGSAGYISGRINNRTYLENKSNVIDSSDKTILAETEALTTALKVR